MEFESMSRYERIDMMRKRFEWLSKLARNCSTLEEFCYKYDEYLGVRGIALKRTELNVHVRFCGHEYETYSIAPNISGIQVSPLVWWQNELCANEQINIMDYEATKIKKTNLQKDEFLSKLNRYRRYHIAYKVIIAGGRDFENYEYMVEKLDELFYNSNKFKTEWREIKIISGMAKGADTLAIRYADEHKLTKILFPANWKLYPRAAGFLRNEDMLSIATHLIAFWDGKSSGTKHMIDIAQEKGIPVWVFKY